MLENADPFSTQSPYEKMEVSRRKRLVLGVCTRSTYYSIGLVLVTSIFLFLQFSWQLFAAVVLFAGILPIIFVTRKLALSDKPDAGSHLFITYLIIVVFINALLVDGFMSFLVPGYLVLVITSGMVLPPIRSYQVAGVASLLFLLAQIFTTFDLDQVELPSRMTETITTILIVLSYIVVAVTTELSTRDLRRALGEATRGLISSNRKLEKASEMKSQFTARTTHELRTPLSSIIVFADLALREAYGPLNTQLRNALEFVVSSARRLKTIINNILDLSKIEAGELTLDFCPIELRSVIDPLADKMMQLAVDNGLQFYYEVSDDMPRFMVGDEERIAQIIENLVTNAVRFTEAGSVHLHIDRVEDERWQIHVRDTGKGIPYEYQKNIFEPYYQLEPVPGALMSTGLGLSITRHLVELMGGKIEMQSRLGRGTSITIDLPLIKHEADLEEAWKLLTSD
jgi:signal transduction histidine kinase